MDKNRTPMDEDSGGRVRVEGGVETGWRGAIGRKRRNNCNNLNNKDLVNLKKHTAVST